MPISWSASINLQTATETLSCRFVVSDLTGSIYVDGVSFIFCSGRLLKIAPVLLLIFILPVHSLFQINQLEAYDNDL